MNEKYFELVQQLIKIEYDIYYENRFKEQNLKSVNISSFVGYDEYFNSRMGDSEYILAKLNMGLI